MSDALEKLARARLTVRVQAPYLTTLVYAFVCHADDRVPTMCCSKGMVLLYNETWLLKQTDDVIAAGLVHESMHIIHEHHDRFEQAPHHELANLAMDLAINPMIKSAGWDIPDWAAFPAKHGLPDGLIAEEYYERLKRQAPPNGGDGEDEDGAGGAGAGAKKGIFNGGCGSCVKSPGHQKAEEEADGQFGKTEADKRIAAKQTRQQMKEYAKGRGNMPGGFIEDIDRDEPPKIRWQTALRFILHRTTGRLESGGGDYSRAHPTKRSYVRGTPRPGLVDRMPEVVMILDTSGSMGNEDLKEALGEAAGVLKGLDIDDAWFLQADTCVSAPAKKMRIRDFREVEIHGRGGTDFDAALQEAEKLRPKPDLIIYFTDGDGGATYCPKGSEVVWVIVSSSTPPNLPFGHVVHIPKE